MYKQIDKIMATKREEENIEKENKKVDNEKPKTCFVIMPISDNEDYGQDHFRRVYEYIIKPACYKAGFEPLRADEVKGTQVIVIDILQRIISSDMAICDLSSRNPNVLYELGIMQSFDLPVTLIKDDRTPRVFDIQGFRDIPYHSNLRIDEVNKAVDELAEAIKETFEKKGKEINSIIELLGISKASIKDPVNISQESSIILDAIQQIRSDMLISRKTVANVVEDVKPIVGQQLMFTKISNGEVVELGNRIVHFTHSQGTVLAISENGGNVELLVRFDKSGIKRIAAYEPMNLVPLTH